MLARLSRVRSFVPAQPDGRLRGWARGCATITASSNMRLPVIDVGPLLEPVPADSPQGSSAQQAVAEEIHRAMVEIGFFYIRGHRVDQANIERMHRAAQKFFALPLELKNEIHMERGGSAWRGFFPVGFELTSGKPDQKEGIYFGTELSWAEAAGRPLHGPNLFPDAHVPELRPAVDQYMREMRALGDQLMTGVALGLSLDPEYFARRFQGSPTQLYRIFNYPDHAAATAETARLASGEILPAEDLWGVREHSDMGCLTILLQDDAGGLEVQDPRHYDGPEGWIAAPPIPGTFVVNIGDLLQRMTHGLYRATLHRVRNSSGRDRLSFPFFYDPAWDSSLDPIPPEAARHPQLLQEARAQQASKAAARKWDGRDISRLAERTYGEFVVGKVSGVFPQLARGARLTEKAGAEACVAESVAGSQQ